VTKVALALALSVASAACGRGATDGPTCRQAGARFDQLERAQLATAGLPEAERDRVAHLIAPMRDALIRACTEHAWTVAARTCFSDAGDRAGFYACESQLTPEQQARLAAAAAK
jgi:hypothetical protein